MLPFYVSPATRPSATLSRDAPSVIRARIRAVTLSCLICSIAVLWLTVYKDESSILDALKLMGWWPISLMEIFRSILLTAILFTGPLFERGIVEGEWREWLRGARVSETLGGWIGWRNYVAVSFLTTLLIPSIDKAPGSNNRRGHVPVSHSASTSSRSC